MPAKVSGSKPAKMASGVRARWELKGIVPFNIRMKNHICNRCKNQMRIEIPAILTINGLSFFR